MGAFNWSSPKGKHTWRHSPKGQHCSQLTISETKATCLFSYGHVLPVPFEIITCLPIHFPRYFWSKSNFSDMLSKLFNTDGKSILYYLWDFCGDPLNYKTLGLYFFSVDTHQPLLILIWFIFFNWIEDTIKLVSCTRSCRFYLAVAANSYWSLWFSWNPHFYWSI